MQQRYDKFQYFETYHHGENEISVKLVAVVIGSFSLLSKFNLLNFEWTICCKIIN